MVSSIVNGEGPHLAAMVQSLLVSATTYTSKYGLFHFLNEPQIIDADHEAHLKAFKRCWPEGDVIMTASSLKIPSMAQLRRLHLLTNTVVRVLQRIGNALRLHLRIPIMHPDSLVEP